MKWINKHKNKNSGMSLIEVVVSMLILSIIAVPLLNSLVIAGKTNRNARVRQYATSLGQNVMESLKFYDLDDVALQFNDVVSGGSFNIVPDTSILNPTYGNGYYEADPTQDQGFQLLDKDSCPDLVQEGGVYKFQPSSTKLYNYVIKGVQEGTKRFDVKITYDGTQYTGTATPPSGSSIVPKQNTYMLPKISSLDFAETAFINPNLNVIDFKPDPVTNEFVYNAATDSYDTEDNQMYDKQVPQFFENDFMNRVADGKATGLPDDSVFKEHIVRTTEVIISDNTESDRTEFPYYVTLNLKYTYSQVPEYMVQDDPGDVTKTCSDIYHVKFHKLSSIYLFHIPLDTNVFKSSLPDIIQIIDERNAPPTEYPLDVYIAEQRYNTSASLSKRIAVEAVRKVGSSFIADTTNIIFHYKDPIGSSELTQSNALSGTFTLGPDTNYKTKLIENSISKQRIYDVKVQVFEHDQRDVLYELNSTITR